MTSYASQANLDVLWLQYHHPHALHDIITSYWFECYAGAISIVDPVSAMILHVLPRVQLIVHLIEAASGAYVARNIVYGKDEQEVLSTLELSGLRREH